MRTQKTVQESFEAVVQEVIKSETKPTANNEPTETTTGNEPTGTAEGTQPVTAFGFVFEEASNRGSGANQLAKTEELTRTANNMAKEAFRTISGSFELYQDKVQASRASHDDMDRLVSELVDIDGADKSFLADVSEEDGEKMLRSQQSKRSRAKSALGTTGQIKYKPFMTLLEGAIAELILRQALGNEKKSGGFNGELGLSEERIEELRNDPDKLAKAIRNVQSKKSIYKAKHGNSEKDARYQELQYEEEQLKSLRGNGSVLDATAQQAIEKIAGAEELLTGVDVNEMTEDEKNDLIARMQDMLANRSN